MKFHLLRWTGDQLRKRACGHYGVNAFLVLTKVQRSMPNVTPIDHCPQGGFSILLGTNEKSPPKKKKTKIGIVVFSYGSGHIHLPVHDPDFKLEGESWSGSK